MMVVLIFLILLRALSIYVDWFFKSSYIKWQIQVKKWKIELLGLFYCKLSNLSNSEDIPKADEEEENKVIQSNK